MLVSFLGFEECVRGVVLNFQKSKCMLSLFVFAVIVLSFFWGRGSFCSGWFVFYKLYNSVL